MVALSRGRRYNSTPGFMVNAGLASAIVRSLKAIKKSRKENNTEFTFGLSNAFAPSVMTFSTERTACLLGVLERRQRKICYGSCLRTEFCKKDTSILSPSP